MRGQRAAVGTIRPWAVNTSHKKGFVRVRNFIKVDDTAVKLLGLKGDRHAGWMPLARFNWLQANGPDSIPPGKEVIHKSPPPEVSSDELRAMRLEGTRPDTSIDDIGNLTLAPAGGVNEKIQFNRAAGRKQRARRRTAVTRSNQRRCRVNDALTLKPHRWYPVRPGLRQVVMQSARTCKAARELHPGGPDGLVLRGDYIAETQPYASFLRYVPEIDCNGNNTTDETPEPANTLPLVDVPQGDVNEGSDIANLDDAA